VVKKAARPRLRRRKADASTWVPLRDPAPGAQAPVYVPFKAAPDAEALAEARCHLEGLEAAGRIEREDAPVRRGTTHAIETDARGHRRLVRKRFSAR
jgi:hypothetical protein